MALVILVVDDHPETRNLIERTLRLKGYEVTAVADGEAALTEAATRWPELIIADVFLPKIDGLSVIDMLRQQDPNLPVIAISAVPDILERPELVPTGLDPRSIEFLSKPFSLPALVTLVHHLLPHPRVT